MKWSSVLTRITKGGLTTAVAVFLAVLIILFYGVFLPNQTLASNDGPLGRLMEQCHQLPGRFLGCWADLNNIGFDSGAAAPGISFGLQWILGSVLFSKFYALLSLLILGVGAWCYFRRLGMVPAACILGGLAMMLNTVFFSVACWGVCAHDIAAGMFLFALAALSNNVTRPRWLLIILAGFAIGMNVTEGADVGAIFSAFFAICVVYQACISEGSRLKNLVLGAGQLVIVVVCAALLAAQAIHGLVSTSITGVAGTEQDVQTKAARWGWATQWSLPKIETLGLLDPGLFGYRLDTPSGGEYWGITGRSRVWEDYFNNGQKGAQPATGFARYTGGGSYLGLLVTLVAVWSAAQLFRPQAGIFSPYQRKWLWFWLVVGIASLLFAFGRYAPFYHAVYALPYFSTIRNPTKFLYLFGFAIVLLFTYGIDGLWRKYLRPAGITGDFYWGGFQKWWNKTGRFEKNWVYGCALVWIVGLVAWYVYWQHLPQLTAYLASQHIDQPADSVAKYSVFQPVWFAVFFFLAAVLFILILSGAFSGKRAVTGAVLLGFLLFADLGLANWPWIVYWDYPFKYASNPVIDLLRQKPYEHRAVMVPIAWPPEMMIFRTLYKTEWMEQQFPYYNIQTFDVVEMPRVPEDFSAFQKMLNQGPASDNAIFRYSRGYLLTNTRYVLAPANFDSFWNQKAPATPLQPVTRFNVTIKPGLFTATNVDQLTAVSDTYGRYAVFALPSALPRAKLYNHWQVNPDNTNVLQQLFNPSYDPHTNVFVAADVPDNSATNSPNPPDDAVQFASYASKDLVLKATNTAASILLLNDHYHPDWKVFVDGAPEKLLRCNFLMQGVYLQPGDHTIEFKYRPGTGMLYVSLAAILVALAVLGIFIAGFVKSLPPVPVTVKAAVAPTLSPAQTKPKKTKAVPAKKR